MRTLTCPPESLTLGANLQAFTDNLRSEETRPIVEKHGLGDVSATDWFPTQKYLDILNEMAQSADFASGLVAIGIEIGLNTPLPEGMEDPTLGEMIFGWDEAYQMLHRNADVGTIGAEKVEENHYKTIQTDVYPDDLSYGILHGYCRRFLPEGTTYFVYYDEENLPRDRGGDGPTVIHVMWQ